MISLCLPPGMNGYCTVFVSAKLLRKIINPVVLCGETIALHFKTIPQRLIILLVESWQDGCV